MKTICNQSLLAFAIVAVSLAMAAPAVADPLVGRDVLKFAQRPMIDTVIPGSDERFHGHDEFSTAYSVFDATGQISGYTGNYMADDFADKFTTPVVHVKWWGSYLNRPTTHPDPVQRFLISFEKDVPAGPSPTNPFDFSHPGEPLLNQIVSLVPAGGVLTPGSGTYTEKVAGPVSRDGPIYEYNAELHLNKEFPQESDTVYWLKIVALVDVPTDTPADQRIQWGWHNRDYTIHNPLASTPPGVVPGEFPDGVIGVPAIPIWHFQDDAVHGSLNVFLDPTMPIMPRVEQSNVYEPQKYLPPWDGPSIIGAHSKDLAFELYTVPEPAACMLMLVGVAGGILLRRRHRAV